MLRKINESAIILNPKSKPRKVINMSAININKGNFENVVLHSNKPVLIDFWAPWCGPCRMQTPIIEELANEVGSSAVVTKLNVDESPELAAKFSVMSIPTLVVIKDGKVISRKVGVTPKAALKTLISSLSA
jgi:thioredoxin 1